MEKVLQNTIIAKKYSLTLKSFFKDEFRYWNDCYLIPFTHFEYTKRQIFGYIQNSCSNSIVCSKLQSCDGHQFLQFIELIHAFQRYSVIKKKVYFEYFLFTNFKLTSNAAVTLKPTKIKSWRVVAVDKQELNHLTYYERLSFLNGNNESS